MSQTREEILERALAAALTHCGDFEAPLSVHALIESALPIQACQCDGCRAEKGEILLPRAWQPKDPSDDE